MLKFFHSYSPPSHTLYAEYLSEKGIYEAYVSKSVDHVLSELSKRKFPRSQIHQSVLELAFKAGYTDDKILSQIERIKNPGTFFVITGHQLCLALGPAFMLTKIISAIKLSRELKGKYPEFDFVPLFWMASEDHDVDEILHFSLFGKTAYINKEPYRFRFSGSIQTQKIAEELRMFLKEFNFNDFQSQIIQEFLNTYEHSIDLSVATAKLIYKLFGDDGILVFDAQSKGLKSQAKEMFLKEARENFIFHSLNAFYSARNLKFAVHPQIFNFFLDEGGLRIKPLPENKTLSKANHKHYAVELLEHIIMHEPERISPNVLLRVLYQQMILPCVAYVGGPVEVNYWAQMIPVFHAQNIVFPKLILRPQGIFIKKNIIDYLQKNKIELEDLSKLSTDELIKKYAVSNDVEIDFEVEKKNLEMYYDKIIQVIAKAENSLKGAAESEKTKALNGLLSLREKYLRALKKKNETFVNKISAIHQKLFPQNQLNERVISTMELLLDARIEDFKTAFYSNVRVSEYPELQKYFYYIY
ncbi:MAG: bacillithiol biosynthesis cysteine-adding enzyme BshC [Bacteroidia bacterium]|nr:bacillithiol biosynthesis cysteine-adding enzyme BshC [Bacteroidia bacterium]